MDPAAPQWRSEITQRLAKEGLPHWYIERLVCELDDHCRDLSEAGEPRPHEQLGRTGDLVDAAMMSFRSRTLLGRRPLAGFLGGPMLLAAISWIGYFGVSFAMMRFTFESLDEACREQSWLVKSVFLGGRIIPPMLATGVFMWLASRSGQPFRWLAGSLATLCLFFFFGPAAHLSMPTVLEPEGILALSFPFSFISTEQLLGQLVQASAVVVTAGAVWTVIRSGAPLRTAGVEE